MILSESAFLTARSQTPVWKRIGGRNSVSQRQEEGHRVAKEQATFPKLSSHALAEKWRFDYRFSMSVEEIKQSIAALSAKEQSEVTAFLFHLRHVADANYQERVTSRISDRDPAHWVTPEEFERRLDGK
jgi:hypothetical protein